MANTTYAELADALFDKIKDYTFLQLDESVAYEIVINYIRPASVRFENCKQDLADRSDQNKEFNFTLTDESFVILVNYMVIEWLESNYILTANALKARLSPSDFHSLNLHNQLGKAMELRDTLKRESDQLAKNRSFKNSKLFELLRKKV